MTQGKLSVLEYGAPITNASNFQTLNNYKSSVFLSMFSKCSHLPKP